MTVPTSVGAGAAILMEAESGRVLYEQHAHTRMPMASTTKIMTALVVLEHCELTETV
ncbi:MAG: D-alanyl-D-alanine carboxypeptidase, partial [Clostridia bacterium]|nr:D-alanyl-D-alanine carboxypeptidase [Clostridia bacterium]